MVRKKRKWVEWLWDAWCIISIVGIWPRFIEPYLLSVTKLSLSIPGLPEELVGLKIVQFSDLHWSLDFPPRFLKKITGEINSADPDLILFTGDFLNRSVLEDPEGLSSFLCSLSAKEGCFAVLGNHDYEKFVTISREGNYDVESPSPKADILKGFKRLLSPTTLSKKITDEADRVGFHQGLIELLHKTPFRLLHNQVKSVSIKGAHINILGLGEYMAGKANPKQAFQHYDKNHPGIILVHNPDMIPRLDAYPGNLVLSGHTHGGQVNLPGFRKRLTCMEDSQFKRGLKKWGAKWCYINRGLGSVMRFRWFAIPELSFITLVGDK
jgi:predicted MPP superfamily phosphohydrolase